MKKNGFTLIELLAVIVVLAIIALIAVPIILGVIDKAKLGAAKASAIGYVESMEKEMALGVIKGQSSYANSICELDATNQKVMICEGNRSLPLKFKGTPMDEFRAIINEKGYIISASWVQGAFCGDYSSKTGATAYKCSEFRIDASEVEFIPEDQSEDADENWKKVENVQQALDYLYGI